MAIQTTLRSLLGQLGPALAAGGAAAGVLGVTAFVFNDGLPVPSRADTGGPAETRGGGSVSVSPDYGWGAAGGGPGGVSATADAGGADTVTVVLIPDPVPADIPATGAGETPDTARSNLFGLLSESQHSATRPADPPIAEDRPLDLVGPEAADDRPGLADTNPNDPSLALLVPNDPTAPPPATREAETGGGGVSVATAGSGGGGGASITGGSGGSSGGSGGGGGGGGDSGEADNGGGPGPGTIGVGLGDGSVGVDPLPEDPAEARDGLDDGQDPASPDLGDGPAVLPDDPVDPDTHIKPLVLFDEMKAQGGPDLVADHGFQPITMMYAVHLWEEGESRDEPNLDLIRERAALIADGSIVCVDIEEWELRVPNVSLEESEAAIDRLILCLQAVRETNPTLRIGLYRLIPERNWKVPLYHYWLSRGGRPAEFSNDAYWERREDRWEANNQRVERLAEHVDVVFPSLYTFTDDPDQWEVYARMNIEAARRYGKPVYAFIWPRYHQGALDGIGGNELSAEMWTRQLQVLHYIADGAVVWSSGNDTFEPSAPWWQATLDYQQAVEDNPLVLWGD